MAVTCLSGTSGALYYKPAGTTGTFVRVGAITGPDFFTTETSPLFMGKISTSYVATVLS